MNAIVISLGSLHPSNLGCYGGACIDTPALDRFATNAFVFDQCYVECPCPQTTRRNWWTGRYQYPEPKLSQQSTSSQPNLISNLRAGGVCTVLIRDTALLAATAQLDIADFEQIDEISRANDDDTTEKVFESAKRWLSQQSDSRPFLLFVDCHGAHPFPATATIDKDRCDVAADLNRSNRVLTGQSALDEAERNPHESEFAEPGQCTDSGEQMDPGLAAACRLDQQVGEFLEWLQVGRHWDQSLIVITSDMGCVSEHRGNQIAGPLDLHESLTHLPLLVRYPGIEPAGRSSALVQSIDLTPTVFDAIGVAVPIAIDGSSLLPICRHERKSLRDCARLAIAGGPRAIRTTNWYLIESDRSLDEIETAELRLFLKPVDRWEHDDVAKQYPEVVAELSQLLEAYSTVTSAFADSQRLGRSATEKW